MRIINQPESAPVPAQSGRLEAALRVLARMIARHLQQRHDEENKTEPPIDAGQKPGSPGFEPLGGDTVKGRSFEG